VHESTPGNGGSPGETVDKEVIEIQKDIARLGVKSKEGGYYVKFGVLLKDEKVQQFYEALVDTLKEAKKRGLINFQGETLRKGPHDNVNVGLVGDPPAE